LAPGGTADFTWLAGERLIRFGEGALEEAPALLAARGFEGYALLTTKRALGSAPILGEAAATVLHVPPGPVPEAAAAVRDGVGGRPLVALGGGRVIDSARAIAGADGLPSAAVPTTLSGAEMTPFHRMPAGVEQFKLVRPSLVIAVPELMASQPMPDLAASGMNALAHAVEALYTPMANPVATDAACRGAAFISLALRTDSEIELRTDPSTLALGALLAGYASGSAGFAVHHAVCQTIVRTAGTPHAYTNAVMLPHFVRMMVPRAPAEIRLLGAATGASVDGADRVPDHIAELAARAEVKRLSELGVERAALDEVVEAALAHPALGNTPDPPDREELRAVLEGAL
jgi:maleylacetate reductase